MIQLGEHFASDDRGRHSEWLRQQQWFIKARQDNQRRDAVEDKAEQNTSALASAVVMATATQIEEFEIKLNSYDEATVVALMENQELMDAVNARIDALLAQAYVMEDGRRVFRTEDGAQVFDEFGGEVTAEELSPDLIDPSYPTWEAFSAEVDQRQQLTQQRTEILEFQEKVDAAHEQITDGELSEADLAALDADLLDAMPLAVRDHVAGLEPVAAEPDLKADAMAPTAMSQIQNAVVSAVTPTPNL